VSTNPKVILNSPPSFSPPLSLSLTFSLLDLADGGEGAAEGRGGFSQRGGAGGERGGDDIREAVGGDDEAALDHYHGEVVYAVVRHGALMVPGLDAKQTRPLSPVEAPLRVMVVCSLAVGLNILNSGWLYPV